MGDNFQGTKNFVTLNHLNKFPPDQDRAVYPSRWYLRSPENKDAETSAKDNKNFKDGVARQLWFSSEVRNAYLYNSHGH